MSESEKIKNQNTVESKNLTPEEAAKKIEEIKEEELEGVAGGIGIAPYGDYISPAFKTKV